MKIIGKKFLVDFGMAKAILEVESEKSLTFITTEKDGKAVHETETVAIKLVQLRQQLFLLSWKEKNGNTITQVQDHREGKVFMNWTHPDGKFINMEARIKPYAG